MSIDWPASLVTIRYKAFYQCDALVTLDLPEGLVRIEYRAFYGCENLASVNFPSTLEYIGDSMRATPTRPSCASSFRIWLTPAK